MIGLGRYRHLPGGVVLLGLLGVLLVGAVGWRLGWFGPEPRPRELLSKPIEPPSPVPAAPAPAPVAPAPAAEPPPRASAPAAPSVPTPPPATAPPAPREAAPSPGVAKAAPAPAQAGPPSAARFAVEFGPFGSAAEAERVEQQLNEAGYQTVRFRQKTGGALFAVLIEAVPGPREAHVLLNTLRGQGFDEASVLPTGESLAVRVGELLPLRGAVELAGQLKAKGHMVRVATQPGEAVTFVIRHGNFTSRQEAEEKGQELAQLGLPNHVVRAK